ncbi:MAG: hypothetical protein ACKO32_06200 [Planctomycetia bacterium]
MIEVFDVEGRPLPDAKVFFATGVERCLRASDRLAIGSTDASGRIRWPKKSLDAGIYTHVAARASGHLPGAHPIVSANQGTIRLVLGPAHTQRFRCTDLDGNPVPSARIFLSRFGVPTQLTESEINQEWEAGFDATDAILIETTDEAGCATFEGLREGRYRYRVLADCHEDLAGGAPWIQIPRGMHEVRLAPVLCGVVQVVGDQLYTHSIMLSASDWIAPGYHGGILAAKRRLEQRYPGALVFASAHASSQVPRRTVRANLLLARSGRQDVDIPLLSACMDPEPLIVEVKQVDGEPERTCLVNFTIKDKVGRAVACPDLRIFKDKVTLPLSLVVTPGTPMLVPYGKWTFDTHHDVLQQHFQPKKFELSLPEQTVEVELDIELVPVRVALVGYRGRHQSDGYLTYRQFGRGGVWPAPLDRSIQWLRPGDTAWQYDTDSIYKTVECSIPIQASPDGDVQEILIPLELDQGR